MTRSISAVEVILQYCEHHEMSVCIHQWSALKNLDLSWLSMFCAQVPWANLGKAAVVVLIDRLYILAGPKIEAETGSDEEYEVSSSSAPVCMTACLPVGMHAGPANEQLILIFACCWQAEALEREAKKRRVDHAELQSLQVGNLRSLRSACKIASMHYASRLLMLSQGLSVILARQCVHVPSYLRINYDPQGTTLMA
jgi:hypothetical protein